MNKPVRKFTETVKMRTSLVHRVRSHRYFPAVLLVIAVLMISSVHIWQRVKVLSLLAGNDSLVTENQGMFDQLVKLDVEIARLGMHERIERYAADSLGLLPISADHIFTLYRDDEPPKPPDQLAVVIKAIECVTKHMPIIVENDANAGEAARLRPENQSEQEADGQ